MPIYPEEILAQASAHEGTIELGTVGWDNREEWFDKGSGDDDGFTFVYVTLYRGKDPTLKPKPGLAAGHRIRCVLGDGVFRIPPKGTRCYIAIPAGMETTPGAGVIFATAAPGPERFDNLKDGATVISASGNGQARIIERDDGSIEIRTTHNNSRAGYGVSIRVAPDQIKFVTPWGELRFDVNGWHITTASGAEFGLGGIGGLPSPLDQIASYCRIQAGAVRMKASAQSLGVGSGDALAASTATLAAFDALQTALGDFAIAIAAGLVATGGVTSAAAGPAFTVAITPALTALTTALAAAHVAVPTTTSSS